MHAVIFDIDGTLLLSASVDDDLYRAAVHLVLGPVDFRSTLAEYEFVTDSGILTQVLDDNSITAEPSQMERIKTGFVSSLRSHIADNGPFQETPGARRRVEDLCTSDNYAIAVATGGWRESAELKLTSAGFDLTRFPLATSSESSSRVEIMSIALAQLGDHEFQTISYYGDGTWDRDACLALGWQFHPVGPDLGGIESFDSALS